MPFFTDRMRRVCFILAIPALAAIFQGCASGPEPLVGLDFWRCTSEPAVGERLSARLSQVDDVADVWIVNDVVFETGYFQPALRAEWKGPDAFATGDLTRSLDPGVNYVILTLFNRKYTGPSFHSGGGKYRARLELFLDGRPLYEKRLYEQYNEEKLIFAAVVKTVLDDGRITIQPVSPEEKVRLTRVIQGGLARLLHRTKDDVDVEWEKLAYEVITEDPEFKRAIEELRKLQEGMPD